MIRSIFDCLFPLLVGSLFTSFCVYMGAYDIQQRYDFPKNRFKKIDKKQLGRWRFFIASPSVHNKDKYVFLVTLDGEKWAIIHFLTDILLLPIFVFCLLRWTSLQKRDVYLLGIFVFEISFAVSSLWIHIISNRILTLPKEIIVSDYSFDKHVKKKMKMLKRQYPESEYRCELLCVQKNRLLTRETFLARVYGYENNIVFEEQVAKSEYSKYYNCKEITLLNGTGDD